MSPEESTLLILLLILVIGLIVPELFKKLHIPFVSSLIIVGAILGPNGLDYMQSNETIEFFGFLGFTFLMLMAGLETKISDLKHEKKDIAIMSILNGGVPFLTGLLVTRHLGYSWMTSMLLGTIFISTSVSVLVPTLKSIGIFKKSIGKAILSSAIIVDIIGLFMVAIMLQNIDPVTNLPLPIYFSILAISVVILRMFLPKFANFFIKKKWYKRKQPHEGELRFILVVLIAVLLYFALLGVHPILAAFLVGLLLSDVITHDYIYEKFHTIGYGIFIPVFFFIVGMELDLRVFQRIDINNMAPVIIVVSLILSKFLSGYVGGMLTGMAKRESAAFGVASITKISTALAVAYAASSAHLIDEQLVNAIIIIPVITTIIGPTLLRAVIKTK